MANTYLPISLDNPNGGGGGGGGSGEPAYVQTFVVGDWGVSGPDYQITVPEATHEKGASPIVQVYELNGSNYEEVTVFVQVSAAGNVIIKVGDGSQFNGKIIIGD